MRISDWSSDVCSSDLQVGKAAPALGCVENVILVDAHPRQRAALAGDPVTQVRQFFFLRQQRLALGKPFVPGDDARAFTGCPRGSRRAGRSEEHTSELQSLMRISYAVFCLKKNNKQSTKKTHIVLIHNKHVTTSTDY